MEFFEVDPFFPMYLGGNVLFLGVAMLGVAVMSFIIISKPKGKISIAILCIEFLSSSSERRQVA